MCMKVMNLLGVMHSSVFYCLIESTSYCLNKPGSSIRHSWTCISMLDCLTLRSVILHGMHILATCGDLCTCAY